MHGVLNLAKPPGMSSHDAVAVARRALGERRIGHTGTLDPAAAGVLPLCVGQATRLVEWLQAGSKEYVAEALFGLATDSGDLLGATVDEVDASGLTEARVVECLPQFRGAIEQTPPLHSAVKVGGVRLYSLAHAGETAEIPSREVTISRLELLHFTPGAQPRALLRVECSGGTYIRSLIRDLGAALGLAATLAFLVRTRSGEFKLADAVAIEEMTADRLIPLVDLLTGLSTWSAQSDELSLALLQGRLIPAHDLAQARVDREVSGVGRDLTDRVLVSDTSQSLYAMAVPVVPEGNCAPLWYRAEKVFDLKA